jgi:hypothetical protein
MTHKKKYKFIMNSKFTEGLFGSLELNRILEADLFDSIWN